jgi:hypothetical protein
VVHNQAIPNLSFNIGRLHGFIRYDVGNLHEMVRNEEISSFFSSNPFSWSSLNMRSIIMSESSQCHESVCRPKASSVALGSIGGET